MNIEDEQPNDPSGGLTVEQRQKIPVEGAPPGVWRDEGGNLRFADGSPYNLGFAGAHPAGTPLPTKDELTGVTPPPAPAAKTGGGGGTGPILPSGSIGSLLGEFGTPQPKYVDADSSGLWDQIGAAPNFPTLPTFTDPTGKQAEDMPGYAFARDQALQGLTNSAAARGVTNTGGTLEDIVKFGNQFATQNYQTTRANALENYQNNIWAQYLAPYQAAQSNWQTKAGLVPSVSSAASTNANNLNNFNRGTWQDSYAAWRNHGNDTFNRLFALDTLGSNVQ